MVGCNKTKVDASPGHACFKLYKTGGDGDRVETPSEAKVGEEVGADISCAAPCSNDIDLDWGDGEHGQSFTHKYTAPGTYQIRFRCTRTHKVSQTGKNKHRKRSKSTRYESTQSIVVTQ